MPDYAKPVKLAEPPTPTQHKPPPPPAYQGFVAINDAERPARVRIEARQVRRATPGAGSASERAPQGAARRGAATNAQPVGRGGSAQRGQRPPRGRPGARHTLFLECEQVLAF